MNQDLSIIQLILHASVVVQLVIALLMAISIASWAAIFRKYFALKRVHALNEEFEGDFWSGTSLNELAAAAKKNDPHAGPMERIFASGMREYQKLRERRIDDSSALLDGARRAMRATVWGIMHSFTGLAAMTQVTLATVAPGIAEALVATAIGLFAAIPAVVAYNRFAHDIDRIAIKMETFMEEFSNILQRNLSAKINA